MQHSCIWKTKRTRIKLNNEQIKKRRNSKRFLNSYLKPPQAKNRKPPLKQK